MFGPEIVEGISASTTQQKHGYRSPNGRLPPVDGDRVVSAKSAQTRRSPFSGKPAPSAGKARAPEPVRPPAVDGEAAGPETLLGGSLSSRGRPAVAPAP